MSPSLRPKQHSGSRIHLYKRHMTNPSIHPLLCWKLLTSLLNIPCVTNEMYSNDNSYAYLSLAVTHTPLMWDVHSWMFVFISTYFYNTLWRIRLVHAVQVSFSVVSKKLDQLLEDDKEGVRTEDGLHLCDALYRRLCNTLLNTIWTNNITLCWGLRGSSVRTSQVYIKLCKWNL